jgi:PKD repeat protein
MAQVARAITSPELVLLRKQGDWSRAFLAIYKPNVIYTARLNGAPTSTDMVGEITFDGGTGTLTDVKAEMTLWVGTSAGARDLGVCRIRKEPIAGTIYIGFTSEIDWADDCYLTIVDHAMLSKKPVIVDTGGVTKMDGEVEYTDQYEDFDPVPVLSCHTMGTLIAGEVELAWDASNSWVFGSTIASYLWEAPGSLSIDDNTSASPVITYDTAGNYPVYCTVTAANGKSATGIQFAFVYDENNSPYAVEVQEVSADYDGGGWEFRVKMFADADPADVIEGALCVLFADDYYGVTKQSLGQLVTRENIICWGYISGEENIEWDAEASAVEFSVMGPHYWLDQLEVNPLVLNLATSTPATWDAMPALTVDRALWHVLHYRTNATALLNITLSGDARYAPKFEASDGSPWAQMNEIAGNIFGRIGCDRLGRFFAVIDPQCVPEGDRTWATVMTLTKKDWKDSVSVMRSAQRKLAMLSTSGWVVDASASVTTLYSLAMGHVSVRFGASETIDKILAVSQAQFNTLTGLYMGWRNNEYTFEFSMPQNNRMIDLWPNQFLSVSLAAGDTPRGIAYAGHLIPRSISLQPDPETGIWSTNITCEAETFAELAVDGDIPVGDDFDSSYPPMPKFPPMPPMPFPYPDPTEVNLNLPEKVVILSTTHGVRYTVNGNDADPTKIIWLGMNSGINTGDASPFAGLAQIAVTPSGSLYVRDDYTVWRADGVGGFWVPIATSADFSNQVITGMCVNPNEDDVIGIASSSGFSGASHFQIATAGVLSDCGTVDMRYPICVCFAGDTWYLFGCSNGVFATPWVYSFESDGTPIYSGNRNTAVGQDAQTGYAVAIGGSDTVFQWDGSGAGGYNFITDGGATVTRSVAMWPTDKVQAVAFSPTGTYAMGTQGSTLLSSSDGGASWSGTAMTIGPNVWENCRDDNRWLFGGGSVIRVTLDRGATYKELMGNLLYTTGLMDLNIIGIRFIE